MYAFDAVGGLEALSELLEEPQLVKRAFVEKPWVISTNAHAPEPKARNLFWLFSFVLGFKGLEFAPRRGIFQLG